MYNLVWTEINSSQKLGTFCEYYAKMALISYGMSVYTAEVDDHGIDFVAEGKDRFLRFQVKSIRTDRTKYVFMKERYFSPENSDLYLFLILLRDNEHPKEYIIPASAWRGQNDGNTFVYHGNYKTPEYGINVSAKNMGDIEKYSLERMISVLKA